MHNELEMDAQGRVISQPLAGYTVSPMASIVGFLAIEYPKTPEHMRRKDYEQIQLRLTPQQCIELGSALVRLGEHLLAPAATPPN